jgi:hypothetical protein
MATIQDLRDLLAGLQAIAVVADARLDQLGAMIAQLKSSGQIPQSEVDEFAQGLQQVTVVLQAIVNKQDNLLAS